MNEGLVPTVVKGNEHTDKLLTALTKTHSQAQTVLQNLYCSPSVTVSLMKLNNRFQG